MQQVPCPERIFEDCGSALAMGAAGGFVVHGLKGAYHAPVRYRAVGFMQNAALKAPGTGGGFAMWGLLFSGCDCLLLWMRGKHDFWNPVLAGGMTGGLLAARAGGKAALISAMMGAGLLAMIEGGSHYLGPMMAKFFGQPNLELTDKMKETMKATNLAKPVFAPAPAFIQLSKPDEAEIRKQAEDDAGFVGYNHKFD